MEAISFEDVWKEHLTEKAKRIKEERAALDKSDPKYAMKVVALAREEKELEAGFKNFNDVITDRIKLDNESFAIAKTSEANEAKAQNEADKIVSEENVELAKLAQDKRIAKIRMVLDISSLVLSIVGLVHSFMELFFGDKHFKIASKFEDEDAYLKLSDQTVVRDALKSDSHHFWQRNR